MQTRWGLLVVLVACNGDGGANVIDASITGDGMIAGDGPMNMIDAMIPGGTGEPAELAGITLYHNQVRAMVQTDPPLPFLEWEPALAATAAAWVAQCQNTDSSPQIIDHNPNRSQGHPYYVGENIFASGGTATAQGAVNSWKAEAANYNYANNTCNGVCGHYTQIVWRSTVKIGCARGSCPNIQYPSSIVCDYGPGGNVGGARPY
jgi:hypothetical protein